MKIYCQLLRKASSTINYWLLGLVGSDEKFIGDFSALAIRSRNLKPSKSTVSNHWLIGLVGSFEKFIWELLERGHPPVN